ncbi:S-layer homology domain-containing protein [Lysinibacillus sp. ZYM-1]|uniref:CAP and S-layer homology domain-containing protein n=1 Tax=Lysinibacillus sp. ZYM-1 TaxID=1681184 RepID=UPI0006CE9B9B|nr:S-layer homology domain-containing protein [Lysinibacillus sp. ZYM-1]KPN97835.1 S-layer protein [Lysinibacillus sp. ZYM-1]
MKKILSIVVLSIAATVGSLTSLSQVEAASAKAVDVSNSYWANTSIQHMLTKQYMTTYSDNTFKPEQAITRAEAAAAIARSIQTNVDISNAAKFKDVPTTHPYYNEICQLVKLGVIQKGEAFHPEEPLKRMQVAKMLALAYQFKVDGKNNTQFADIPRSHWANNYIESLADIGIISGVDVKHFAPDQLVTRAQFAVFVERSIHFQQKINKLEVAYDYLAKDYIPTVNLSTEWSKKVVELINVERQKKKLEPVVYDPELSQIAIIKAQDMVKRHYFEHVSPYYGAPWDLATLFDYNYTSFGENIARNIQTPEVAVKAWMASPSHRDNILKEHYTNTGVAIAQDSKGNYYWVQMFSSQ